jgi:hypothetical protein
MGVIGRMEDIFDSCWWLVCCVAVRKGVPLSSSKLLLNAGRLQDSVYATFYEWLAKGFVKKAGHILSVIEVPLYIDDSRGEANQKLER